MSNIELVSVSYFRILQGTHTTGDHIHEQNSTNMPYLLVEKAGTHLEQQYHYLEQLKQNSQNKPSLHTTQFGIFFSHKNKF